MSNGPDKELKQNMNSILTRAQTEWIAISRHGRPCAVLVGIEDYDAEDLRFESSEQFWRMIRQRRASGKSVRLEEVEARLAIASGKPSGKRAPTRKTRKNP
jgi:prevent-host-death family protein